MANDNDWVEDVKRWYHAGGQAGSPADPAQEATDTSFIGYEAAHPALQARHWPDAAGFGETR